MGMQMHIGLLTLNNCLRMAMDDKCVVWYLHWYFFFKFRLTWQELEYPDSHTSQSIYVAMPLETLSDKVSAEVSKHLKGASLAIWTTTPWTIPANMAVAVNADLDYIVAEIEVWTQFQASEPHMIACFIKIQAVRDRQMMELALNMLLSFLLTLQDRDPEMNPLTTEWFNRSKLRFQKTRQIYGMEHYTCRSK